MTLIRHVAGIGVFAVAIGAVAPVSAQVRATTADLSGVVLDESNAAVPRVVISAANTATGLTRSVDTGPDGRYVIPALPPGVYQVTAAIAGFSSKRIDVRLPLGEPVTLDFTLRIVASEHVTVVAERAPGTTRQGSVATVVSGREIEALPTNGRNFIAHSVITPGANVDRTPQQGASASSGLTFVGQRGRSNNITVDGLDNNDFVAGGVRATFSQEAVQEFQVLASSYSAEFGKAAGGVVNIVTKSGTNTTAGNLFTYFRHDALNAKEHFERFTSDGEEIDRRKAPYRQHQFGGTLGGPLRRNRSFFFVSGERLRVRANNFVTIKDEEAEILRQSGFSVEVGHVPYRYESDQLLAKVDTRVKRTHDVSVRFNWADLLDENIEPWGGQVARSRGAYLDSHDLMGAASLMSIVSPRTVNELRFQVASRDQKVISFDSRCAGVCDQIDEGGPAVNVGSIQAGRHPFTPQPRENHRFQLVDTFSRYIGRHHLKWGGDLSWVYQPSLAWPVNFGGYYSFESLPTFQRGQPDLYIQSYGDPSANDKWFSYLSLFAQDDWQISDRLTLQMGVRYQNQFFPRITQTVAGLPPYGWPADNNNAAPRIGVSWNPTRHGQTSFNGSYGIFHDNHPGVIWGAPFVLSGTADHVRVLVAPSAVAFRAWNAPGRQLSEPEPAAYSSSMTTIDPRLKTPSAHHASLGVDRILRARVTVSARVVYVRGFDQVAQLQYNPVINGARPRPGGGVNQFTSWADSWYRALIVSVQKRQGRSQFLAVYTLSKAEDMATDYAFSQPQDNGFGRNEADPTGLPLGFDPDSERGPSLQDQRHRFVLSGLYVLPGNVTLSGIVTLGSGRPYNIIARSDLNGDRSIDNDRPWREEGDLTTRIGRNAGLLPPTSTVDVHAAKRLAAGRRTLDLIVELFNLFNHTNFTDANAVFGRGAYPAKPAPAFGQFTKAGPPFQAQLAVKFSF